MKKPVLFFTILCLLFVSPILSKAGKPPVTNWTSKNLFEQKVFIENKGQYSISNKVNSKDILFGARQGGLSYYFTANGIWIERYVNANTNPESPLSNGPQQNYMPVKYNFVSEFHKLEFIGSSPETQVTGYTEVKQYYNFKALGMNIKANAYTKITYTNLYPGIDMVFYFPENKQGFEYDFIVHPGADVSLIKMQYPLNKGITLSDGNVIIQSDYGRFIDHAPVARLQGNSQYVSCSFSLQNGIVQFKTGYYNKNENLIIDPWTAVPVFPFSLSDRAYDVDWDDAGNCYAYGGSGQYSEFPLYMIKYDNTGALLWETQIKDYYTQDWGTELYGDFVVIKSSQSIFVDQGVNIFSGSKVLKLDQSGAEVDSSAGNLNMNAIWRIAYSTQYNELVGVGGSYPNYPAATAMYIDTNLTTETIVDVNNPPNPYYYMWGVTLDNAGNCYMGISGRTVGDTAGNDIFKVSMPTLTPTAWEVSDGYTIDGVIDPQYIAHNNGNGINGMTVIDTELFTYDSYTLKEWSTNTGKLIDSLVINVDTNHAEYIYWGGITSDTCGNIFLGSRKTIEEFSSNLNFLSSFNAPDSIYDLSFGNNNTLYACGATFVAAYQLTPHVVNSGTLDTSICLGNSIPLQAAGAITYAWSPSYGLNATTGDSVLASPSVTTTYTVICSGSLSCPLVAADTFKFIITVDTIPLPDITVNPTSATICFGKSVTVKASGDVTTYQWTPVLGLNNASGDSVIATPTISTTYTVKGIDTHGCYDVGQCAVTVDTLPQVSVFDYLFSVCAGQPDTLYATGQSAYQWSPSTGLSATTGDTVVARPYTTMDYFVTVVGQDGCSNINGLVLYVDPTPDVIVTPPSPSVCPGDSITLALSGAKTYQWNPSTALDSIASDTVIANPTTSTTYTIIGTNRYGCMDTVQTIVAVGLPKVTISPSSPSFCSGQNITLSASGADTYQWSPSTGLNNTSGDTIIANPAVTTTYSIIGNNGCSDTVTTVVTVDSLPVITIPDSSFSICLGESTSIFAEGGNAYQWSPSFGLSNTTGDSVTVTPTALTTYTVIGTNINGCSSTATAVIGVILPPNTPGIAANGDTLTTTATTDLQWYRNDSSISGATNPTYIAKVSGWYEVIVSNPANGCSSISDSVYINLSGINQVSQLNNVHVFPNPFNNIIYVTIGASAQNVNEWVMQITDVLGRTIYSTVSLNYNNAIDLSSLPQGVYFITIDNKTARSVFPVVRQE